MRCVKAVLLLVPSAPAEATASVCVSCSPARRDAVWVVEVGERVRAGLRCRSLSCAGERAWEHVATLYHLHGLLAVSRSLCQSPGPASACLRMASAVAILHRDEHAAGHPRRDCSMLSHRAIEPPSSHHPATPYIIAGEHSAPIQINFYCLLYPLQNTQKTENHPRGQLVYIMYINACRVSNSFLNLLLACSLPIAAASHVNEAFSRTEHKAQEKNSVLTDVQPPGG